MGESDIAKETVNLCGDFMDIKLARCCECRGGRAKRGRGNALVEFSHPTSEMKARSNWNKCHKSLNKHSMLASTRRFDFASSASLHQFDCNPQAITYLLSGLLISMYIEMKQRGSGFVEYYADTPHKKSCSRFSIAQ